MKMKFRGPAFLSILVALFLFAAVYPAQLDNSEKETVLMRTLVAFLDQLHFNPKSIDDQFSEDLYHLYMERLDYDRRLFTQKDLEELEPFKNQLDEAVLNGTFEFFDRSQEIYHAALEKTQGYYRELLKSPFDLEKKEVFELDSEKRGYAKNDRALRDYWRQMLKFRVLSRVEDALSAQEDKGSDAPKKSMEELEAEAREAELKRMDDLYGRFFKNRREHHLTFYLRALTNLYDPHTDYYEPKEKEDFDINMSGKLEGIGATLTNEGEYVKVSRIIVGGPAWKQKGLEVNDKILKVKQEATDEVTEIVGMLVSDAVQYIRGKKGTDVTLTVKKMDGSVEDITITRDVVIIEEYFAKSLILDGMENDRLGYIKLPSFYADFQNADGRFSSKDVEAEINKLQKEGVDGIILDLRDNGGGSLNEVVRMSGLFIESGPVVQVKDRVHKPEVLKDTDPRVQYNGPLVVLVNGLSASASEILAAALQDYGRAVIIGGKSTFGKGTVQRFLDLDRGVRGLKELKPLGEVKITTQKFYRVDGGSVQLRGVEPDIVLPDSYHYIEMGEKEQENALRWTKIEPLDYGQQVFDLGGLETIQERSAYRVERNEAFRKVLANAERLKAQRESTLFPLDLESFAAMEAEEKAEAEKFSDLFDQVVIEGVHNPQADLEKIEMDDSRKARNEDWKKRVARDIYLQETLAVMHDLIHQDN